MMASPAIRRLTFRGTFAMSLEWVPGVVLSIVGSAFALWKAEQSIERRVAVNEAVTGQALEGLKTDVQKFEDRADELEHLISSEIREATAQLTKLAADLRVITTEQAITSKLGSDTLKSIVSRLEYLQTVTLQHEVEIKLLKAMRNGGAE